MRSQDEATSTGHYEELVKLRDSDQERLEAHDRSMANYLALAIEMYAHALQVTDAFDQSLVRLLSLWMSHFRDDALNVKIQTAFTRIPSWKVIPFVHQLSGRLDSPEGGPSPFQTTLQSLLFRIASDHPFHVVYQLFTLRDSHQKPTPIKELHAVHGTEKRYTNRRKSLVGGDVSGRTPAGQAAAQIIERVAKSSGNGARVKRMEKYIDDAMDWCTIGLKKEKCEKVPGTTAMFQIPKYVPLAKIRDLDLPIPTHGLAVDPTCAYGPSSYVNVKSFKPTFQYLGGQSRPKLTVCIGSDGVEYPAFVRLFILL